jgi:eukaryotic-like serine/threonine-protein kinase
MARAPTHSLNHPNIAHIYGFEDANGHSGIVMELVEGETLERRLMHGPLALPATLCITAQIAEALEAAHGRGVLHRDLKPANIVVTSEGSRLYFLQRGGAGAQGSDAAPATLGRL